MVGVVPLEGPITESLSFVRRLRAMVRRADIEAIVIRIDSPGGAVAPSQEIYSAIRRAARRKPVVAQLGSVAASGGYWAALAADWIVAAPGSMTGSIGVLMQGVDAQGLAELLRVRVFVHKAGEHKDIGNPFRPMTDEDRRLIQTMLDDVHGQFRALVAERRNLEGARLLEVSDGRVLTGRMAHALGLVDALGDLTDASMAALARTTTGTTAGGEAPTLVFPDPERDGLWRLLEARAGHLAGVMAAEWRSALLGDLQWR